MRLSDFSVAKKIWLLVGVLVVSLLGAGAASMAYTTRLEADLRAQMRIYEGRITQVLEWQKLAEGVVQGLVVASLNQDERLDDFLREKIQQGVQDSAERFQAVEQSIASEQGRAQIARILAARKPIDVLTQTFENERMQGLDTIDSVQERLEPAVQAYSQELAALVQIEVQRRDALIAQGQKQREQALWLVGAAVLASLVVSLLLARWLVRQVTLPLARAVGVADTIAAGDLTVRVDDSRQDELGHLLRSLEAMAAKLRQVVTQVRGGVDAVAVAAGEIASGSQDLSSRTEQTAANLEETAASMEQLTATVSQASETARQANQLAGTAMQAAGRGGEVVQQVVHSMEDINASSRKISDIIGVIDGIAFQTNILALNAAVEAARAGEQGRGFAVVATEVRVLAQRSAEAAKEIKQLIADSVASVDAGASQVALAGQNMEEIVASVRRVTDLIGEITASSVEQTGGITQVNQAVASLDQMTQQNAALVEESSAAAAAMREQTQRLAEVVSVFNVGTAPRQAQHPAGKSAAAAQKAAQTPKKEASTTSLVKKLEHKVSKNTVETAEEAPKPAASTPRPTRSAPSTSEDDWETF